MALTWWPRCGHEPQEAARRIRAVICVPRQGDQDQQRAALLHCVAQDYDIVAVAQGRTAWWASRRLVEQGRADVVVTVPGGPQPSTMVEVAAA